MNFIIQYLKNEAEDWKKRTGKPVNFDYEDGAVFVCHSCNGRFNTIEAMLEFMEIEQREKEEEEDRIQTDEYYRSEQYKIDKAMEMKG